MNTRLLVAPCAALFAALTVTACAPLQTQQTADNTAVSPSNPTETRMRGIEARLDRLERQLEGLGNLDLVEQVQRLQQETRDLRGSLEQNSHRLENFQAAPAAPTANLPKTAAQTPAPAPLDFPELPVTPDVPAAPPAPVAPPAPAASQFEIPDEPAPTAPSKVERAPAASTEVDTAAASLGFGAPAPLEAAPVVVAPAATPPKVATTSNVQERGRYEQAFDLLKNGRYGDSITAFESFLKQFPNGELSGNAQYWLGEAHYVTRAFDAAVREFSKVIDNYPNSLKYADSLLKLGYVHYELKQWQKARARLTQVIKKKPGTTIAKLAQQRLDRIRREGN